MNDFCNVYNLSNLVKEPTCFKNPDNPSCIDLFLTNRPKCFQSTMTMETGISDFHKMVITVLKLFYEKQKPKIIHYRNYKTFNANLFKEELNNELLNIDINNAELVEFTSTVLSVLDKHAPIKRKYIRANNSAFMTKELRAAIMQRSKLRQKFLKERTNDSKHLYNRQRNLCVSLLRKTKRDYFKQLNNKVISDNKKFWQTISSLLSEKGFRKETIILKDSNRTITNNHELAETFNTFFSNITQNLKLDSNLVEITENLNISDPVIKAIKKYEKHPSIIKVKEKMKNKNMSFSFTFVTKEAILNELRKFNPKKACQESDIPVKIIKENLDTVSNFVYNNFNNSLFSSNFPSHLKNATITPIFKKKERDNVENYRPVNILPNLSKIYERCMYIQIYEYLNKILSKWQCGFRQGYSAQHCLLVMVEKWRQCLDNGGKSRALLTHLSKANANKFHLLATGNYEVSAYINEFGIESSKKEKLLGTSIDTALSFEHHITYLCKKACHKLQALARIAHYMDFKKRRSLMKAFIIPQFNYCPLIWMFGNRALNNRINKIHELTL